MPVQEGISWIRVSHAVSAVDAVFDDPNLVSCGGLEPVAVLAARAGLHDLVRAKVKVATRGGANPALKVPALVLGMVAGAGLHRRHGSAAARRDGSGLLRGPGALDVGHVPGAPRGAVVAGGGGRPSISRPS